MEMQEQEKKFKIQRHKEALMDKDIEGCTFQPQVNPDRRANQRSGEGIRTFGEFQQDQNEFLQRKHAKEMRLKYIKEKEIENELKDPKINRKSRKIAQDIRYAFSPQP